MDCPACPVCGHPMTVDPVHEMCVCTKCGTVEEHFVAPHDTVIDFYEDLTLRKLVAMRLRDYKEASKVTLWLAEVFADKRRPAKHQCGKIAANILLDTMMSDKERIKEHIEEAKKKRILPHVLKMLARTSLFVRLG